LAPLCGGADTGTLWRRRIQWRRKPAWPGESAGPWLHRGHERREGDELTRGQVTCRIEVSPEVVDAGAEMMLHAVTSCVPACDLRGHNLLIKDHAGADASKVELINFDSETNETAGELVAKAPITPGAYTWSAVCPSSVNKGVSYSEASTPISLTVKPHTTSVLVWDTPSAVVAGERFRTKIGIKCSSECNLTNRDLRIYDHKATQVSAATLPGDR